MTSARAIMSGRAICADESDTLARAAQKMRDGDVGALPVSGAGGRLKGMITDRDIVVKCIAEGIDPRTAVVGDYRGGGPVTVGADDSVEMVLQTMIDHDVRRVPVIEGHTLLGMISQADIAVHLPEELAGLLLEAISAAPANN